MALIFAAWFLVDTGQQLQEAFMEAKYRLIPEDIPPISKATVYEKVLNEFLGSKDKSARVEVPKKKPATIHQGLLKAKRMNSRFGPLSVVRRQEVIYLKK